MDRAREQLTQASHKLAEEMYRATQSQQGAPGAASPGGGPSAQPGSQSSGDVVDAEYVDVDEKKAS